MRSVVFLLLTIHVATWGTPYLAAAPVAAPLHAGPVFTQAGKSGSYPIYPDLQIQIDVPPGTDPKLLNPDNFLLSVDGGTRLTGSNVQTLASTGYGVAAGFALDVSGSMRGAPLEAVRAGLTKFVGDAGPQDKVSIETIADNARWDANWDDSRDQVRSSLAKLAARGQLTRLWDGLLEALRRYPESPLSRRLIVISDGHDEGSVHHEEEVIAAAREQGVVIDAIGLTRSSPAYLQTLERLAAGTGGVFRRARDTAELQALIGKGVERLKATPVVSYRLDHVKADGASHQFAVTWLHEGAESAAETSANLPKAAFSKRLAVTIGGAVLLLLVGGLTFAGTRKRKPAPLLMPQPVPSAAAEAVVPKSAGQRSATFVEPPVPGVAPRAVAPPLAQSVAPGVTPRPAAKRAGTVILGRFSVPSEAQPGAWLLCEQGPASGTQYPLKEREYWIGALENNHLQLTGDPTVSSNHACLAFDHDLLSVHDNNSTNGTWVNGEPLRGGRRVLNPQDRLRIGQSTFAVEVAPRQGMNRA